MAPVYADTNLDNYRTANELIKTHGADATIHSAMRADKLLARGDVAAGAGGCEGTVADGAPGARCIAIGRRQIGFCPNCAGPNKQITNASVEALICLETIPAGHLLVT
jgi:hypothetical protein